MSIHLPDMPSEEPVESRSLSSQTFDRYDLTGSRTLRWRVRAQSTLVAAMQRVLSFGKQAASTELPGSEGPLGLKAKTAPGKILKFVEARIDQTPIENQLKAAQTETEYLRQELLRQEIAKTAEETKGQKLDNFSKELEIRKRIQELTSGRTDVQVITIGEVTSIVFADLPPLASEESEIENQ